MGIEVHATLGVGREQARPGGGILRGAAEKLDEPFVTRAFGERFRPPATDRLQESHAGGDGAVAVRLRNGEQLARVCPPAVFA